MDPIKDVGIVVFNGVERLDFDYLLVESVHTPNGPRQKVICSLGDLSPRSAREWLRLARKVEDALVGQVTLFSDPDPEVEQIIHQVRSRQARSSAQVAPTATDPTSAADLVAVHFTATSIGSIPTAPPSSRTWWNESESCSSSIPRSTSTT
jgi:hypothetical protein